MQAQVSKPPSHVGAEVGIEGCLDGWSIVLSHRSTGMNVMLGDLVSRRATVGSVMQVSAGQQQGWRHYHRGLSGHPDMAQDVPSVCGVSGEKQACERRCQRTSSLRSCAARLS